MTTLNVEVIEAKGKVKGLVFYLPDGGALVVSDFAVPELMNQLTEALSEVKE